MGEVESAVLEDGAEATLGSEIRRRRLALGLSQAELANRVGYSREYVSRSERKSKGTPSSELVRSIDAALEAGGSLVAIHAAAVSERLRRRSSVSVDGGIPATDLVPERDAASPSGGPIAIVDDSTVGLGYTQVVPAIRVAMQDAYFAPVSTSMPVPASNLERRVGQAWRLWHASPDQRTSVGLLLPNLIRDAHDAVGTHDRDERRRVRSATGDLYHLVQRLLAHIAEPELHALAVERGRVMSEMADTPNSLALAAWSSAIAVSAQGHFDEAVRIADAGSRLIRPLVDIEDPEALGVYGALQL